MWSVGTILGEMLGGAPMFPGKSTVHQLELVVEITGRPNKMDIKAIKSKHTAAMLESLAVKPQKSLQSLFPTASVDALDLMSRLLVFNPEKRLSVQEAIRHPYLAQFHNSADEPILSAPIHISIDDNKRYKISEYRKYLYRKIVERKKQLRAKRAEQQARMAQASGQPVTGTGGQPTATSSQPQTASGGQAANAARPSGSPPQGAQRPNHSQASSAQQPPQQQQQQQQQAQRTTAYQTTSQQAYNVPNNAANQINAQAAGQRKQQPSR
jgi:mitogen-activated protein kinase 15